MNLPKIFLGAFLFVAASACSAVAQVAVCTPEESIRAESSVTKIKDWPQVYEAFRANRACNGESVVEVWSAYSEAIATLLADHWDDLEDLSKLASVHPEFKAFVIQHLTDETIPESVLSAVRKHAAHECRSGSERLCKELAAAAK